MPWILTGSPCCCADRSSGIVPSEAYDFVRTIVSCIPSLALCCAAQSRQPHAAIDIHYNLREVKVLPLHRTRRLPFL